MLLNAFNGAINAISGIMNLVLGFHTVIVASVLRPSFNLIWLTSVFNVKLEIRLHLYYKFNTILYFIYLRG